MLSKFRFSPAATLAACLLCSPFLPTALAQTTPVQTASAGDNVIVEMNRAFKRGDRARLSQLLPQARGHALEPWAAYWEMRTRLGEASAQEVQSFLSRYAGTYQEDRLRNDWLLLLGQRRDWAGFAAEYPNFRMNDDREVRCYALLVEHLKNPAQDAQLAAEVKKNWFAQRDADDGCTAAADRLVGTKTLTGQDAWHKARLATEANRPRAARDAVQIVSPESVALVAELHNSPAKFLNEKQLAIRQVRKEIITLALVRLATMDLDSAAFQMESKWGVQLTAEERNWVWGLIGQRAASRLGTVPVGDALRYFARVTRDSDLTDEMLAWKTRAALRAGSQPQWPLVLSAINAMSDDARKDPTWAYWKARALIATAPPDTVVRPPAAAAAGPGAPTAAPAPTITIAPQRAEGLALLQSFASVRGFYEQLALEELGQKITVPTRPAPLSNEEKEAARLNPGLNRAAYAMALGMRSEGVREWNYTTNLHQRGGMGDRELLAAAQFACDRQIWDRCINTSERTRTEIDLEQRFPMPFRDAVVKRTQSINLDPAYVYGLIRQESRFIMDARSVVGASGLMQVMPATARWTAKKIGLDGFTIDQLNDRDTNIAIGTAYLKLALDDLGGSMPMAAAAYNAGPGRPRLWRNGPVVDAAIWAENVPFHETRDYVKKVLANTTSYAALLTGQPQSLKARLGTVGPRDGSQPEPNRDLP
ncbi:transglycosylase SLT domain-containing protein [Polaromonas sp. YR568]|uniref:lytic transglycosylase domain-containing protein n=1 Tax=Polaromonas sp. YR568 TaxID=1855301 RepID=UPI003137876A